MQKGQVGFSQKDMDYTLLWRAAKAHGTVRVRWHGYGTVGEGSELYLLREGVPNSVQPLYLPPNILIGATWNVVVYDPETGEIMHETNSVGSEIFRDTDGITRVYCDSDGAKGVIAEFANPFQFEADATDERYSIIQVAPVPHRSFECIEIVVSDPNVTHTNLACVVEMRGEVLDVSAEGLTHIPAGGTSSITTEN